MVATSDARLTGVVLLRHELFLESRDLFAQVDWPSVWGLDRVVLVVPQAILRELDDFKADPRRERSRPRQRAVKVLQVLMIV
jgi:hypothetical protein